MLKYAQYISPNVPLNYTELWTDYSLVYAQIINYVLIDKCMIHRLNNIKATSSKNDVPSLVEIWPVVLENKIEMQNVNTEINTRSTGDQKSSLLHLAQRS